MGDVSRARLKRQPPHIAAVSSVASGANTTYDNRIALDTWTIERAKLAPQVRAARDFLPAPTAT
jgi:hypothetical protein